jgi:hypothetical protein
MEKGGMMKKFLVLLGAVAMFIACDYATESTNLYPDVEIISIDPLAQYVTKAETLGGTTGPITVTFIPENSVDCYLTKCVWEYYDQAGDLFYGPQEIALYLKIEGRVGDSVCEASVKDIVMPTEPVADRLEYGESAKALLSFIFVDEYWGSREDTATTWFVFYMWPDTTDGN